MNAEIPRITCSDRLVSLLEDINKIREPQAQSLQQLVTLLRERFAEISNEKQALGFIRRIEQNANKNVQIYTEIFISLSEDAYPRSVHNEEKGELI